MKNTSGTKKQTSLQDGFALVEIKENVSQELRVTLVQSYVIIQENNLENILE